MEASRSAKRRPGRNDDQRVFTPIFACFAWRAVCVQGRSAQPHDPRVMAGDCVSLSVCVSANAHALDSVVSHSLYLSGK